MIPVGVLFAASVSVGARLLYAALKHYAWSSESCWPGQERLADELGVSEKSLRAYLKELQDARLIRVRRRGLGKTNLYFLPPLNGKYSRSEPDKLTDKRDTEEREEENVVGETALRSVSPPPARAPSKRARDPVWDTLADFFPAPTNNVARGRRNKTVGAIRQSLRAEGIDPMGDEAAQAVSQVCEAMRSCWSAEAWSTATDIKVAVHWDELRQYAAGGREEKHVEESYLAEMERKYGPIRSGTP